MRQLQHTVRRLSILTALVLLATACSGLGSRTDERTSAGSQPQAGQENVPAPQETAQAPAQSEAPIVANPQVNDPQGNATAPAPAATSRAQSGGKGPGQPSQRAAAPAPATGGAAPSPAAGGGGAPASPVPGSPSHAAPVPAASGPDSQGVSQNQIKIGLLMPISGAVGFLGEAALAGARAYFQMVNADGGAKGRQYQLIVVDTQFEPSVEALGTKRLVEQDKVLALMSVLGDSSASYVASKGIPEAALGASPTAFSSRYPNIYPVCCNVVETAIQWPYQLTQVQKLPIKTVGILYGTENIPVGQWLQYFTKAWEIWGVQVKSTDAFNLSDGDCTSIVLKMRSLNIDYWDIANSLGWPLCGQSMTRQNYKPPLGFGGTYTPDAYFIAQAGSGVDGVYGGTMGPQIAQNFGEPYEWDPSGKAPQTQRFVDSVKKYSPRNGDIRSLESGWTISYWVGAQLIDQAIKAQPGAITWKGMNDWIQGQRDWRSGLLAPMSFDPKCKIPAQWRTYQWKWNGSAYEQTDWHQYADKAKLQPNGQPWGHWHMPAEAKNKIIPGAGDCLATALADVVVRG